MNNTYRAILERIRKLFSAGSSEKSAIQLYSSSYITVEYHPKAKLIYHTIHQPMGKAQFDIYRDALNAGTDTLEKYGLSKWLSDDRKNGPLPDELLEWGKREWNPRTVNAGWKYWANVVPTEIDAASTYTPLIEEFYKHGVQLAIFTSVEEAQAWLASVG